MQHIHTHVYPSHTHTHTVLAYPSSHTSDCILLSLPLFVCVQMNVCAMSCLPDCRRCKLRLIFLMPAGVWSFSVCKCVSVWSFLSSLRAIRSMYCSHWIYSFFSACVWWSVSQQDLLKSAAWLCHIYLLSNVMGITFPNKWRFDDFAYVISLLYNCLKICISKSLASKYNSQMRSYYMWQCVCVFFFFLPL